MKNLLLFAVFLQLTAQAQTKVITLQEGKQKVVDLDSLFLKRGTMYFFEGTETGRILLNANKSHFLKTWITPDTIQLNNGKTSRLIFVFQESLDSLTNEWAEYSALESPDFRNPYGIGYIDSSEVVNIGGEPHRRYIEYWAEMKYKLGAPNSAGEKRRLVLNGYFDSNNVNWPATIPYIEKRRWHEKL